MLSSEVPQVRTADGPEQLMPIYEYRCESCGKAVERLCSLSEADAAVVCPDCGKKMKRLMSAPGGIRMGNGRPAGTTCCGSTERCERPPCTDGSCRRD
jgi:putative FmdB family regulatory protein